MVSKLNLNVNTYLLIALHSMLNSPELKGSNADYFIQIIVFNFLNTCTICQEELNFGMLNSNSQQLFVTSCSSQAKKFQ